MTLAPLALHGLLLFALSHPTSSPASSHAPDAPCEVSGEGASSVDVSRATRACEVARERFRVLFGEPVPSVEVSLWDEGGYRTGVQGRRAVIYWPTSEARARTAPRPAAGPASSQTVSYEADPWAEILPHEISHVLLAARFFGIGSSAADPDGYGTPLPDWLDEGVAIWAEPAFARADRLREARALAGTRRELGAILGGHHPATTDPRVMAMRDGAAPPDDENLWTFYPQAIAMVGFIFDAGGQDAMVELVQRLAERKRAADDMMIGLPGLPSDAQAITAAWERWLVTQSARSAAAIGR